MSCLLCLSLSCCVSAVRLVGRWIDIGLPEGAMASNEDTVLLHGDSVNIVKQLAPVLTDVLLSKFGCKAKFHVMGHSRKPPIVPEQRFSVQLAKGLKVSVWKADLSTFSVDAVVNAANVDLKHYGGLALALSEAGGPEIQAESDNYTRKYGRLEAGNAIITTAGKLPCKKVIHAVGPNLPPNPSQASISYAEPQLKKAVTSILDLVKKHNLQSVAIPALSSGLFNFPLARCADIIVTTLKEYHDRFFTLNLPHEIQLVNHDEPSVEAMKRACQQILVSTAPSASSYSQAVKSHGTSAAKTSTTTVQIGNVCLTLEQGKIEEQKTDVIVNTTSQSLNLSDGQISKAISVKAGRRMQNEIYKKHGYPPSTGSVVTTGPHNLQCKSVYHTVCASRGETSSQKILCDIIKKCLQLADSSKHQSIAFPAIGTGNLGFDKGEVAQIMTEAVYEFAQQHRKRMDIHFVIYPNDNDTWRAFEHQLRFLSDEGNQPSSSQGFEHRNEHRLADRRASSPQIKLSAQFDEMTQEAKHWLEKLLFYSSGKINVQNNFIQHLGQQEFQQLSRKAKPGVSIEEFFNKGSAGIMVQGKSATDVTVVGLEVEAMLCDIQKEFVKEEVQAMRLSVSHVSDSRKPVGSSSSEYDKRGRLFPRDHGPQMIGLVKLENPALKELFELKEKQLNSTVTRQLYQRIPAQFCSLVSHIGFQREYAPPDDPKYGEGIYFTDTVGNAMKLWSNLADDKYLYFVEAKVLTGKSIHGSPDLIVPPPVRPSADPLTLYDSVEGRGTHVIFNGYQALPEYIIICNKV